MFLKFVPRVADLRGYLLWWSRVLLRVIGGTYLTVFVDTLKILGRRGCADDGTNAEGSEGAVVFVTVIDVGALGCGAGGITLGGAAGASTLGGVGALFT